jgi:hypothetical protein
MAGRSAESAGEASQLHRFQASWRSLGIGVGAIGTPVAAGCLHPLLGLSLFAPQAAMLMIIFGAALFGSKTISERAFRLLRWLAGRPEPAGPSPSPTASGTDDGPPRQHLALDAHQHGVIPGGPSPAGARVTSRSA